MSLFHRFELTDEIGDINCSNATLIAHELTVTGTITSIGVVEKPSSCPKCYSNEVENSGVTG